MKKEKTLTLKTLNKSNIWDIQENDIFRMWESAGKDADLKDNMRRYLDIIRSAFYVEEIQVDKPEVIKKYESNGYKIGTVRVNDDKKVKWAIRKRPILRVTDLTYENIHHISAIKLMEVLNRNFGGGWESLPQSIQDIIESGFDISTTTLPKDRLHKSGGLYEKKVKDGYEVLEIPKGTWVEAIFAKEKPEPEKIHMKFEAPEDPDKKEEQESEKEDTTEKTQGNTDHYNDSDEDEDEFDDDKLTEESYRTTYDANPEDLNIEAEDIADDDDSGNY
ncbi:MAG: hypothetical protein LKH27_03395 [Prevotella sp.]|jgi:hypothetical protein|nr:MULTISPECIES: hypothetical protein [unclassified Prevotella]MCH3969205.1 hypothetical protein [Prevotella sp.]MCH3985773.1 hypothetical protein [Prevotella sp.]MCH3991948.1 hypothetical protein [Prevotella sp.]MCH4017485.1 hypothetical protein [Prevotella sp.]MCH4185238.1 hypothetical protein [Prevotella sp.]